MELSPRLKMAQEFMRQAHRAIDQRRKDNVRLYEVHPLDVFERLLAVGVRDEDVLIAGLFHDILEDVATKLRVVPREICRVFGLDLEFEYTWDEAIDNLFGAIVLSYVVELTDVYTKEAHPDKNRNTRKQLERERYATFSLGAKCVKLADIASNLNDDGTVLEADGRVEVGFNRMFIKEKQKCLPYLENKLSDSVLPPIGEIQQGRLYATALVILETQKRKFDVR